MQSKQLNFGFTLMVASGDYFIKAFEKKDRRISPVCLMGYLREAAPKTSRPH
jgi:hypothetical protein